MKLVKIAVMYPISHENFEKKKKKQKNSIHCFVEWDFESGMSL